MKIRELRKEDIKKVGEIFQAITKKRTSKKWQKNLLEYIGKESFVAIENKEVIGFIIAEIKTSFGLEESGWIELIGISPKYMGRGIGKRLAKKLIEEFKKKGVKEVFTAVKWDSSDLLAFFKNLKFKRSDFINLERGL